MDKAYQRERNRSWEHNWERIRLENFLSIFWIRKVHSITFKAELWWEREKWRNRSYDKCSSDRDEILLGTTKPVSSYRCMLWKASLILAKEIAFMVCLPFVQWHMKYPVPQPTPGGGTTTYKAFTELVWIYATWKTGKEYNGRYKIATNVRGPEHWKKVIENWQELIQSWEKKE